MKLNGKYRKPVLLAILASTLLCMSAIVLSALMISGSARGRTYTDVDSIPHRKVGILLGCSKYISGNYENLFFRNRINAALKLFNTGKVDYLLVSGDNHTRGYDETTDMKDSLIRAGVPSERIYCDFAGFRTLDSIVRAKEVFGETKVTVISQEFHNQRAIFIAKGRNIDAIGFNAEDVDTYNGFLTKSREQLARVKTVMDLYLFNTGPKFLGPKIAIGEPKLEASL
ncbi:MAG: hypothetical protein A2X45_06015 [Lentisphaerae bacterium GWF2_50_93]|nr:MAG: hypothetical protein A2X45_06015 [Lentisphaerae bacterium GWF2_50_93]